MKHAVCVQYNISASPVIFKIAEKRDCYGASAHNVRTLGQNFVLHLCPACLLALIRGHKELVFTT
jgi:hypothetical protein